MTPRLAALGALALLAGCAPQPAQPPKRECTAAPIQVTNASATAVEQLYLVAGGAWGTDRLGGALLQPRGTVPVARPGDGALQLRAVWVNGRAAEITGLDGCLVTRVDINDAGIRAR